MLTVARIIHCTTSLSMAEDKAICPNSDVMRFNSSKASKMTGKLQSDSIKSNAVRQFLNCEVECTSGSYSFMRHDMTTKEDRKGINPNLQVLLVALNIAVTSIFNAVRKREYAIPNEADVTKNSACLAG